ncbi:zinc/iron permease [Halovivax asiaticus JCM 14624]|uniref:Zinc/iron permease n=1 Tax=Halovivax asiaticus JCM 14624 TaxID=1227490 RepID=M0BM75_9EURY|nr:ZIP family metal transporter [Halovivax asiaticus]ELZ10729.1 zinc/iron permease [Halovivax asiaticus JCM 14624]
MGPLGWILLTTLLISLFAWIGVFTLYLADHLVERLLLWLVAFAAGALLGGAFFHLLPRAIRSHGSLHTRGLFVALVVGFAFFYVLEQFIHWHHHHGTDHEHEPVTYLVLVSDSLHNFIDGIVIAGAFLIDVEVGLVTAFAIALHEIPQEIGDFGILVYGGFDKVRALAVNFATALTVVLGGLVGYALSGVVGEPPVALLTFAAGNFIYIASSDLIPEINAEAEVRNRLGYFVVFVAGLGVMYGIALLGHSH